MLSSSICSEKNCPSTMENETPGTSGNFKLIDYLHSRHDEWLWFYREETEWREWQPWFLKSVTAVLKKKGQRKCNLRKLATGFTGLTPCGSVLYCFQKDKQKWAEQVVTATEVWAAGLVSRIMIMSLTVSRWVCRGILTLLPATGYKCNAMETTPELRGKRGILMGKLLF